MGGDLDRIRKVGEYFIEVWKAVGMKMDNVRYWKLTVVLDYYEAMETYSGIVPI